MIGNLSLHLSFRARGERLGLFDKTLRFLTPRFRIAQSFEDLTGFFPVAFKRNLIGPLVDCDTSHSRLRQGRFDTFGATLAFKIDYGDFWHKFQIFFTLLFYPLLLTLAYYSTKLINNIQNKQLGNFLYFLFWSCFGLFIMEWLIIGNSPWSNPDANQLGMFSFWTAVFMMPKIFIDQTPGNQKLKTSITRYFIAYTLITTLLGFILPQSLRLFILVWLEIIGYTVMHLFYFSYLKNYPISTK
jgi:hypothetical protein